MIGQFFIWKCLDLLLSPKDMKTDDVIFNAFFNKELNIFSQYFSMESWCGVVV